MYKVFEQLLVEANMEKQVSVLLFLDAAQLPPGGAIVLLYTADQKNYRPTHSIFGIFGIFPNYADNACFVSQGASLIPLKRRKMHKLYVDLHFP